MKKASIQRENKFWLHRRSIVPHNNRVPKKSTYISRRCRQDFLPGSYHAVIRHCWWNKTHPGLQFNSIKRPSVTRQILDNCAWIMSGSRHCAGPGARKMNDTNMLWLQQFYHSESRPHYLPVLAVVTSIHWSLFGEKIVVFQDCQRHLWVIGDIFPWGSNIVLVTLHATLLCTYNA